MHSCTPEGLPCTWVDAGFSVIKKDPVAYFNLCQLFNASRSGLSVGATSQHAGEAQQLLDWIHNAFNGYDLGAYIRVLREIIGAANGANVETWTTRTPLRIITRVLDFLLQLLHHLQAEKNRMSKSMHRRHS